jgi:iron complex outermembrane receptor protein
VQGNNITIRGVTPGVSAGGGPSPLSATPATAVYVDGVYEGIGSNYDLERVEVLRGPQGTLYGRSATAGVVAFHTRDPILGAYGGDAEIEAGNYDLQHFSAAVNLPAGSTFAVRVAADYRDQNDGYFNEADRGQGTTLSGRVKALWKPSDDLSLLAGVAYERDDALTGGDSSTASLTRAVTTTTSADFPAYKQQREYWAELNWDLGPVVVTYQPTFRTWYQNDDRLQSPSFIGSGSPLEETIDSPLDQFHTEELRVASKDAGAIQWQAGAFYYRNQVHTIDNNFLATPSNTEILSESFTNDQKDTKDEGFFGETTFSPISSLRATLGVRYDSTSVKTSENFFDNPYAFCGTAEAFVLNFPPGLPPGVNCTGVSQANVPAPPGSSINNVPVTFHNFNYKARLEYDLAPHNMVYGMVSTGFRPGDVGIASTSVAPTVSVYSPNYVAAEKLTSYELGSKNRFLDDSLQLNADVYYYDYSGFQTLYVPPTSITPIYIAVPATNIGAEVESLYRITNLDRVGLDYSYVESRFKDEPASFAAVLPQRMRPLVPSTVTGFYEHVFNLPGGSTLMGRIDGQFFSPHRTSNLQIAQLSVGDNQYVQVGSQTIGNLSGTWSAQGGHLSVTAYVRNFTNARYATYLYADNPTNFNVDWNDPRIYGLIVAAHF